MMEGNSSMEIRSRPARRLAAMMAAACFMVGLAFGQPYTPIDEMEAGEPVSAQRQKAFDGELVLMDSSLQNIDAVRLIFPADTTSFVNGVYPLDDNKCMQLPAYGTMCLKGKSMDGIKRVLESAYSEYSRYPFVKVEFLMRIGLLGGFHSPGLYYVRSTTPLWDVIAMGGGPEREDGFQKMEWMRNEDVVKKNLTEEIVSGKSLSELNFKSGDVIAVLDRPKLGIWTALRTEVFPFLLLLASMATAYAAVYSIVER